MFALIPRPIPEEPGMIAMRVLTPATPFEQQLFAADPFTPIYRVTVWEEGRIYLASFFSVDPHDLDFTCAWRRESPHRWTELVINS